MTNGGPPNLPASLSPLRDLCLDLRWTWSHEADALWARIGGETWERTRNPWTVLHGVPAGQLAALADDAGVVAEIAGMAAKRQAYLERTTWLEATHAGGLGAIAYFSMEFGLGEALPLYAGGLGILAGDFLKTASDLGLPMVGVGLLYQEGYFRQMLDADGGQRETYPFNDPALMPIEPAMADGAWLRISIGLPGRTLHLRVWRAQVGRVTLYLLDSNDPLNSPADRGVTAKLYGGDVEMRLTQEIVLGVGGWRALEALGHDIEICHINEGHAAFVVLERAARLAARTGLDFQQALWATRPGNIFTSHTSVEAGFDRFPVQLLCMYLAAAQGASGSVNLTSKSVLGLGRVDPADETELFNMAYLAMRGSGACLGVSRLHGQVSREVFGPLYPRWPRNETPVGHVTNGVHIPTWDSAEADKLWTEVCGKERWRLPQGELGDQIDLASDEAIWAMRSAGRHSLVERVRHRLSQQLRGRGLQSDVIAVAARVLDPNILTLGFARRFTDYKRPNLLIHDTDRLEHLILNTQRPLQIVLSGKAHPADQVGKRLIRDWIALAALPRLRGRIVFLEDYDIALAQELVQGVDVWINTPRRPWEACGTSGMKVLANGGLNCSVSDGWWAEAYRPELGWRIGGDDEEGLQVDTAEAVELYDLLERQIAPEFYDRDATGLPRRWCARVRTSLSVLTPAFSSSRMARQYVEVAYLPATAAFRRRSAADHAVARDLAAWSDRVARNWATLHIGRPTMSRKEERWRISVPVVLGDLSIDDITVELYAEPTPGSDRPIIITLLAEEPVAGSANSYIFRGEAPGGRQAGDFTVRVVPRHADARLPTELPLIAWQR